MLSRKYTYTKEDTHELSLSLLSPAPPFQACLYGRVGTAKLLLEAGADPTLSNFEGLSPMLATLSCPRERGVQIARLLEVGVGVGREGGRKGGMEGGREGGRDMCLYIRKKVV